MDFTKQKKKTERKMNLIRDLFELCFDVVCILNCNDVPLVQISPNEIEKLFGPPICERRIQDQLSQFLFQWILKRKRRVYRHALFEAQQQLQSLLNEVILSKLKGREN